jgi:hypothetical protein
MFGRAKSRAADRLTRAADGRDTADAELIADGGGRGSLVPNRPATESAGRNRNDKMYALKHARDTTAANLKTLDFS